MERIISHVPQTGEEHATPSGDAELEKARAAGDIAEDQMQADRAPKTTSPDKKRKRTKDKVLERKASNKERANQLAADKKASQEIATEAKRELKLTTKEAKVSSEPIVELPVQRSSPKTMEELKASYNLPKVDTTRLETVHIPEAYNLLMKEDLHSGDIKALRSILDTMMLDSITSKTLKDQPITIDPERFANVGDFISAVSKRVREEHVKTTEAKEIGDLEEKIDASTGTQKQTLQRTSTHRDIRTDNFKEDVGKANQLWTKLVEKQRHILEMKISFFGPKAKFVGTLPPSYDGNESGLILKKGDSLVAWLKKKGRDADAAMVEGYEDDVATFQVATADALGTGEASANMGSIQRTRDSGKTSSGFSRKV